MTSMNNSLNNLNNMKHVLYSWIIFYLLTTLFLTSCKNDEVVDSPIYITQIYLEDIKSDIPDRPISFVRTGQMIRIEGEGFIGLKKIYINGYKTFFNLTYVTDNSMIVTVDKKTPIIDATADVRNTIRLVKSNGYEYVYKFEILSALPSIRNIDNTMPKTGEKVTVYGTALNHTTSVTLPGDIIVDSNIENDTAGEWFSFIMPAGVTESGSIVSTGANGKATSPAYFNYKQGVILDFDGTGVHGYWQWTAEGSMINSQDLVTDPLNSGRGKCFLLVPERLLISGVPAGKPRATECWTAGNNEDWSLMYPFIPANTPVSEVAFQFDIYVPEVWEQTGHIQINLFNYFGLAGIGSSDDADSKQVAFYVPWIENGAKIAFHTNGWQTVTIPFSEFKKYATLIEEGNEPTFQMVVNDRNNATNKNFGMSFINTDFTYKGVQVTSSTFNTRVYIDNWRIVPCKMFDQSDYE